jgi:restriction endonuclease Mrr
MPDHMGEAAVIMAEFRSRYGHLLDEHEREYMPAAGTERWALKLNWSRHHLIQQGLLASPERGTWQITDEGLEWLRRFPDATRIGAIPRPRRPQSAVPKPVAVREEGPKMRPYTTLKDFEDLWVPLLEVLAEMPGHSGKVRDVIKAFEVRYGPIIHPQQLQFLESQREPRWSYNLRWSRQSLLRLGLVDAAAWGVWRITQAGLQWLSDHPEETHLGAEMLSDDDANVRQETETDLEIAKRLSFRVGDQQLSLSPDEVVAVARASLGKGLAPETLQYAHWVVMVDGEPIGLKWLFSQVTGLSHSAFTSYRARDVFRRLGLEVIRLADKPKVAKSAPVARPNATDEEHRWLDVVRAEVAAIRDLLRGRGERPAEDRLCDMVQLCYMLGLYREGCALFALVDGTYANAWQYERTRKLARICELRGNHDR